MPLTDDERRELRDRCHTIVPGFSPTLPAEEFRRIAAWFEANGAAHDTYGEGRMIAEFERRIAELVGKAAAAFFPSGVMAQLAAVRVWTGRAGVARFGMHPTSHLILHEEQAYQAVFGLHGVVLGDRLRPLTAADLAAARQPLGCVIAELPIREAGGLLPAWDELEALKALARERGVALHMDGARLWECGPFYGRPYAEIAAGFGSVYVSVYKGLGGLSGAVLAGDAGFVGEARLWRRRMGGTLYHLSPLVASAAMRLDQRLALMGACQARAVSLAEALAAVPGLRVTPARPQACMMHLWFDAPAEAVLARRDAIAAAEGVWVVGGVRAGEVPGWCVAEFAVGDTLLGLENAEVVPRFRQLLG